MPHQPDRELGAGGGPLHPRLEDRGAVRHRPAPGVGRRARRGPGHHLLRPAAPRHRAAPHVRLRHRGARRGPAHQEPLHPERAAAKRLEPHHRLVLTGTPIENSVADLWSIMDFLMPGYLGGYERFRRAYELPIAGGGPDGRRRAGRLRKKLHPFLLRRLKRDVAKDLPPASNAWPTAPHPDQQATCTPSCWKPRSSKVTTLVGASGLRRSSRMEMLKTLTAPAPGLLPPRPAEAARAEIREPLGQARPVPRNAGGGHGRRPPRAGVQPVRDHAHLLRDRAGRSDGIPFCYLDGSTKDRMARSRASTATPRSRSS
jgi:hypothetical protein